MSNNANKYTKGLSEKRSSRPMMVILLSLVAVAALILGGVVMYAKHNVAAESAPRTTAYPAISIADNAVKIGTAGKTIEIYDDMMCPACKGFYTENSAAINEAVTAGKLTVAYHTMDFLNKSSFSKDYSTRAWAAVQCVAAHDTPAVVEGLMKSMFDDQPVENGPSDHTNEDLATMAEKVKASPDSVSCIREMSADNLDYAKSTASKNITHLQEVTGRASTPTILHDGSAVDVSQKNWLVDILK